MIGLRIRSGNTNRQSHRPRREPGFLQWWRKLEASYIFSICYGHDLYDLGPTATMLLTYLSHDINCKIFRFSVNIERVWALENPALLRVRQCTFSTHTFSFPYFSSKVVLKLHSSTTTRTTALSCLEKCGVVTLGFQCHVAWVRECRQERCCTHTYTHATMTHTLLSDPVTCWGVWGSAEECVRRWSRYSEQRQLSEAAAGSYCMSSLAWEDSPERC